MSREALCIPPRTSVRKYNLLMGQVEVLCAILSEAASLLCSVGQVNNFRFRQSVTIQSTAYHSIRYCLLD